MSRLVVIIRRLCCAGHQLLSFKLRAQAAAKFAALRLASLAVRVPFTSSFLVSIGEILVQLLITSFRFATMAGLVAYGSSDEEEGDSQEVQQTSRIQRVRQYEILTVHH